MSLVVCRDWLKGVAFAILWVGCVFSHAKQPNTRGGQSISPSSSALSYEAEARLITIYKLVGEGRVPEAQLHAAQLTKDFPTFHLGHLVYGDLLSMQTRVVSKLGDLPPSFNKPAHATTLAQLREESARRLSALQDRPLPGTIPSQILELAPRNRHVIAIDASKSRLYLLENARGGLRLVMDTYISVGKEGVGKYVEGDLKTPLGIYHLTNPINPKVLTPLYGGGALPINYPNPFDQRLGKSGNGIWLHGTMSERYSRPVRASDGCVVLSNPDLQKLMSMVAIRTTAVIIASKLNWVRPEQLYSERSKFEAELLSWREAKNSGKLDRMHRFYANDFNAYGKPLTIWWLSAFKDFDTSHKRPLQWRDVSILAWRPDAGDHSSNGMVVTYDEVTPNRSDPITKRQYWIQVGLRWKIIFEGAIASS